MLSSQLFVTLPNFELFSLPCVQNIIPLFLLYNYFIILNRKDYKYFRMLLFIYLCIISYYNSSGQSGCYMPGNKIRGKYIKNYPNTYILEHGLKIFCISY